MVSNWTLWSLSPDSLSVPTLFFVGGKKEAFEAALQVIQRRAVGSSENSRGREAISMWFE